MLQGAVVGGRRLVVVVALGTVYGPGAAWVLSADIPCVSKDRMIQTPYR